jgi:hypothetical protein
VVDVHVSGAHMLVERGRLAASIVGELHIERSYILLPERHQ